MIEKQTDLWSTGADAICITTNGTIARGGKGVMGRGVALQATQRIPGIKKTLGQYLLEHGNHTGVLEQCVRSTVAFTEYFALVAFPVKHEWHEQADLELIRRSAIELRALANSERWQRVVLPRPGCGNGRLQWDQVKPIIEPYLDDVFLVVTL